MFGWIQNHVLFMFAIAIVVCNFTWLLLCRKIINMTRMQVLVIAILHDIIGYAAMRIMAILEVGGDLSRAANMRLFGAIFVLPFFYYASAKFLKQKPSLMLDIAAICTVIGLIFGRLDCLVGGCCSGFLMPGSETIRWPIREIELIYYAVFMLIYCPRILKNKTSGEVYPLFMATYGVLRFLLEWLRIEYTTRFGVFHLAHIWSLLSIGIGLSVYFELQAKSQKKKARR